MTTPPTPRSDADEFGSASALRAPVKLDEWRVVFVMRAGSKVRRWTVEVPAADEEGALIAGHGLAYAINEGSRHIWKITSEISAEVI